MNAVTPTEASTTRERPSGESGVALLIAEQLTILVGIAERGGPAFRLLEQILKVSQCEAERLARPFLPDP